MTSPGGAEDWLVTVEEDRCQGSGLCAGIAPAHFAIVRGRSQPPATPVAPDDDVLAAAECCPLVAITVTTVTGKELFP